MVGKRWTSLKTTGTRKKGKIIDRENLSLVDYFLFSSVCKWWRKIITILSRRISFLGVIIKKDYDRDWAAGLPAHLIVLFIERLPLVDCLAFSCVCKLWKRITNVYFDGSSRGIPLLVKPFQDGNITRTCLNVLNNNKRLSLDIPMPEYIGSYICGSYRDWLFLWKPCDGNMEITLLNPFSGENVVLPMTDDEYHMVVVSSVPSHTRCIYMLVHQFFGVAFWTSGAREWRQTSCMRSYIKDALYHEGNFYLLSFRYEIVIINEKSLVDMMNNHSGEEFGREIDSMWGNINYPLELSGGDILQLDRSSLVESCGDILLVRRIFYQDGPHVGITRGFETYRLDISQMRWVKLESLGEDQVLFLGKSCSRSYHAKELEDYALANKMYISNIGFTDWINEWDPLCRKATCYNDLDEWGVFSLQKDSILPPSFRSRMTYICGGTWVTAPIRWCLRQTQKHW